MDFFPFLCESQEPTFGKVGRHPPPTGPPLALAFLNLLIVLNYYFSKECEVVSRRNIVAYFLGSQKLSAELYLLFEGLCTTLL